MLVIIFEYVKKTNAYLSSKKIMLCPCICPIFKVTYNLQGHIQPSRSHTTYKVTHLLRLSVLHHVT